MLKVNGFKWKSVADFFSRIFLPRKVFFSTGILVNALHNAYIVVKQTSSGIIN